MAEAEVKTFWQRQRLAEAEVENAHVWLARSDLEAGLTLLCSFSILG